MITDISSKIAGVYIAAAPTQRRRMLVDCVKELAKAAAQDAFLTLTEDDKIALRGRDWHGEALRLKKSLDVAAGDFAAAVVGALQEVEREKCWPAMFEEFAYCHYRIACDRLLFSTQRGGSA